MKKLIFFLLLAISTVAMRAQNDEPSFVDGVLTYKVVNQFDSVSQAQLYLRAHTFISDWVGPNNNSKRSIEFDDKESATIISKGCVFMGYFKSNMLYGYNVFADYTLTIKCKDGRCQYVVKIPSMTFHWTANNVADEVAPFNQLYPECVYKSQLYGINKAAKEYSPQVIGAAKKITEVAISKMSIAEEDDF